MNARALGLWCLCALTVTVSTSNPVYRALVLFAALNVLLSLRRPDARLRPLLVAVSIAFATATAVTVLLSHTGAHPLVVLPASVPVLGGAITVETIVFGATTGLGIAAPVLAVAPFSLALESDQLLDALPQVLSRSAAAIATALNILPGLARSATEIRDAQRMRGWRPKRVRDWPAIAVPVVLTAVENSVNLAEAMEARGFGARARTHFRASRWRAADWIVILTALAAAVTFSVLHAGGVSADWYPFPSLTAPALDPASVTCCAMLSVPALLPRRAH